MSYLFTAGKDYINSINDLVFEQTAVELFNYQYSHNKVYRSYCDALRIDHSGVKKLSEIPFLPISFFKTHTVISGEWEASELIFESSGTTGEVPSRHFVKDASLYEASLISGFRELWGDPADYVILALLPSYLERRNASLVHMSKVLMHAGGHKESGFYLNEWDKLAEGMQQLQAQGRKVLLLGVTFALLDFAADFPMDLSKVTVMETGGMKGRREEWTRERVHDFLKERWMLQDVATEYGMTELLSQAYAPREGLLTPSYTMRVLVREVSDPLTVADSGSGGLNIIDLANVHSCAFIATEDIGTVYDAGTFEVLGRLDHSALRGCSLMVV